MDPDVKTYAVINDLHGPWHDTRLVALVLDILEDLYLDGLYLNGDIFDFHNINRHKDFKHPDIVTNLEDSFYWGNEFFNDIRKRFVEKGTDVTYIRGNHEKWLDDFILTHAKAFWNFCQLDKMVNLKEIKVVNYNKAVKVPKINLFIQHSPPSYSITGPRLSLLKKIDASFIWGCTHRTGHASVTGQTGNVYHGWFNGWLGSTSETKEHEKVFEYTKDHESWQHCFSLITTYKNDFWVNQYFPVNYKVVVDGNLYEG